MTAYSSLGMVKLSRTSLGFLGLASLGSLTAFGASLDAALRALVAGLLAGFVSAAGLVDLLADLVLVFLALAGAAGSAVAGAALDLFSDPEVLAGVRHKHEIFMAGLRQLNQRFSIFRELRGMGLLLGCELVGAWQGRSREFIKAALDEGLLILVAGPDVIRLAPSLLIPDELIQEGLERFGRAIAGLLV